MALAAESPVSETLHIFLRGPFISRVAKKNGLDG